MNETATGIVEGSTLIVAVAALIIALVAAHFANVQRQYSGSTTRTRSVRLQPKQGAIHGEGGFEWSLNYNRSRRRKIAHLSIQYSWMGAPAEDPGKQDLQVMISDDLGTPVDWCPAEDISFWKNGSTEGPYIANVNGVEMQEIKRSGSLDIDGLGAIRIRIRDLHNRVVGFRGVVLAGEVLLHNELAKAQRQRQTRRP